MLLKKKDLFFIFKNLDKKTKFKLILFLFLVIFVAILEYITINESVIFAKELLGENILNESDSFFGINNSIIFLVLVIFTNLGRALVTYLGIRLAYISSSQICQKAYKNFLEQTYLNYLSRNSSELISIVSTKTKILSTDLLLPLIRIFSSSLMVFFIGISILKKAPEYTIFSIFALIIGYLIISIITSKSMRRDSKVISTNSSEVVKIVQESVSSFREIKLSGFENKFFNLFSNTEFKLRISDSNIRIFSDLPRFIIEGIFLSIIIILSVIFLSSQNGLNNSSIVASLGAFLYGSQRLLPLAQTTYRSLSTVRSSTFSIIDILKYVELKKVSKKKFFREIHFSKNIILKSVGFKYPKSRKQILKDCDLEINKGDLICISGNSGSGKSTLMDILMGLIKPTKGDLYIDDIKINSGSVISWQKKLAHVPQEILLIDDTIRRNIAFGISDENIDDEKISYALEISSLDKVIKTFNNGIDTKVGERGSLLSGGQKQRIGIARAIYQSKEILFLDEATSALDQKTEGEILKKLTNNRTNAFTVIMITHRPRNDIKYDKVIEVKNCTITTNII
tara:strand:+ start:3902 stop:5605 length:1704 start_codon:yes stop_codon:yes gene_type:complete